METEKNQPDFSGNEVLQPRRVSKLSRFLRIAEILFAATGFVSLLLVATPVTNWLFDALDRQSPLAHAKYIVCLGGDAARVIESVRLLNEGYGDYLIVSNQGIYAKAMRDMALEWGAEADKILIDDHSWKTRDHAGSISRNLGVDPARDSCIIVTSFTHMARSRACFVKAGYRNIIMREPRWERASRPADRTWKWRFKVLPDVVYEYAAWVEYFVRGDV